MVKTIKSEDFFALTENQEKPFVLDFTADWWPSCRHLGPVVSSVAEQLDSVDFYKVDVDEAPDLAQRFGVQSIPTLILIKDGQEAKRSVGFIPEEPVKEFAQS